MNKEIINPLEKAFADMLRKMIQGAEKGVDFLEAQLPEVAEQLLLWKMWEDIFTVLFLAALGAGCAILTNKFIYSHVKNIRKRHAEKKLAWFECNMIEWNIVMGAGYAVSIVFLLFAVTRTTWLQILVAPKIYLIEYAAGLLR